MRWFITAYMLCGFAQAQTNLVPNGGFEDLTTCPYPGPGGDEIWLAEPWDNIVDFGGGADIFNVCALPLINQGDTSYLYNVPANHRGYQYAHSGQGYAGFYAVSDPETYPNERDFLMTPLSAPLQAGVRYEVVFYVSLVEKFQYAVGSLGAYFSSNMLSAPNYYLPNDLEPQIQSPVGVIYDDKENWMEIRDTLYIPRTEEGGQQWMTIGNFLPDSLSQITFVDSGYAANFDRSYYYIDDVSVVALDSVPNGVEEVEQQRAEAFMLYPNPNNGQFTLTYKLNVHERCEVRVFDMIGKQVFTQTLNVETNTNEMNLSSLNAGMYLVHLQINGEVRFAERLSILK